MAYICQVCNGLRTLKANCSFCFHQLDDYGRLDNFWEPYSPYRESEDLKMTNGFIDKYNHQCIHLTSCPNCGKDQLVAIDEQFNA